MKLRFRYSKLGKLRWTSQRDVARMWERALRKASVPVSYTSGFSPRPKLSFGLALPTGCESVAEYLDIEASSPVAAYEIAARLKGHFPAGIEITASAELEDGRGSLQQDVTSCAWEIQVPGVDHRALGRVVDAALGASSLPVRRERKGREEDDDLRPAVRELVVCATSQGCCSLQAELSTRPRGVRPSELGRALGVELGLSRRTHQWIEIEGSRVEPLEPDAARPLIAASEHAS
jgi:radical SAM-linked protein